MNKQPVYFVGFHTNIYTLRNGGGTGQQQNHYENRQLSQNKNQSTKGIYNIKKMFLSRSNIKTT